MEGGTSRPRRGRCAFDESRVCHTLDIPSLLFWHLLMSPTLRSTVLRFILKMSVDVLIPSLVLSSCRSPRDSRRLNYPLRVLYLGRAHLLEKASDTTSQVCIRDARAEANCRPNTF